MACPTTTTTTTTAAASRRAVLRAAADLIARHGYEGCTIRAVAARAGVSPSLVVKHFGSPATAPGSSPARRRARAAAARPVPTGFGTRPSGHVELVLGRPATGHRAFVSRHAAALRVRVTERAPLP